ncbi:MULTISPECIES: hypothetical protein [Bradyrhizobium]|uniref:Uncharacterized protein n=1 Tax=Bradyrhizobium barranii subsp. barranii TaxID=2823807 RepID=A0A7Z0TSJ9_9BRAD|nr:MULTISPECIES: hypothetical protein [Bradyrhizobium]MCD9819782.1 hypothetical protein [Bradyrhizobium japonicum]MEB2675174.1 hypothetical protein [Bradyrhizobium japonicum]UEM17332.1 hypothetical protein J4G43_025720 [Bradyrhizobium barranii subsp. barranii]UGX98245.1 hypothetical protein G6321_00025210 [Bradyrhizobium barranii subsp. barranii]WLB25047.1 hypothetical protein QIH85_24520 [Bradyrhizobium japonicum]
MPLATFCQGIIRGLDMVVISGVGLQLAVTGTGWGEGPAAFERLFNAIPAAAGVLLLCIGAIWIISCLSK